MDFIKDLAFNRIAFPGLRFTWEVAYDKGELQCNNELCATIPLERYNCRCKLLFSIVRCRINLTSFRPLEIVFENEKISLTTQYLLDYGLKFIRQVVARTDFV